MFDPHKTAKGKDMTRPLITTLVLDLDNTLWDWVEIWYQSFSAMLAKISEISGLPEPELLAPIREVHKRHGTAEYAFLLQELDVLNTPGVDDVAERYAPAIDAFRAARKEALALYPTVRETLSTVRSTGCLIVGYTESQAFYTSYRIRRLDLDGTLDFLYSPADHDLPRGLTADQIRHYPKDAYQLQGTEHRHTPAGELKPNPDILRSIMHDVGAARTETAYVGDSLMKDIAMAQDCGVHDVFAEYGKAQDRSEYELLKQVTHWTDEDVERERQINARGKVAPTYVLHGTLSDILEIFNFAPLAERVYGR